MKIDFSRPLHLCLHSIRLHYSFNISSYFILTCSGLSQLPNNPWEFLCVINCKMTFPMPSAFLYVLRCADLAMFSYISNPWAPFVKNILVVLGLSHIAIPSRPCCVFQLILLAFDTFPMPPCVNQFNFNQIY